LNNHKASQVCYLGPYLHIINSYGYDISEEYLFGLTQGITFKYSYIHRNKEFDNFISHEDGICIVGSKDNREIISDCYGIKLSNYYEKDRLKVLGFIENEINEGRIVVVYMDVYYLKYHPYYMNKHAQTNLIVYDMDGDHIFILDKHVTTIPISTYEGTIHKEVFLKAMIIGDNPYNCEEMGIVINRKLHGNVQVNIAERVYNAALAMVQYPSVNHGVAGIYTFAEEITKWQSRWSEEELAEICRQAYLHIASRGGPAISRKMYAQFLKKYYEGYIHIDTIVDGFEECARMWNGISIKFFRGIYKINRNILDSISGKVKEIADMEKELFEKLLIN
jgi:hypothetical protein